MNELRLLPRAIEPTLERALKHFPVVVVTGARQTGKTTLVRHLSGSRSRTYRTLDNLRVLEQAERDPDLLVREADTITLDEVQRVPDLLRAIKRAVDDDRRPGRFLLTGSANLLLMRRVSESLAGRAIYLRLGTLTEGEKAGRPDLSLWGDLLAARHANDAHERLSSRDKTPGTWTEAVCEGGFPPVHELPIAERVQWFDGYVTTYVERDLQQIATISALADFRRLLQVSAARIGGLVNRADLARDAGLSRPTTHRHVNLLEVSFLIRLLPSFALNRTLRAVKSPKLYFTDTGLAAFLAGVQDPQDLRTMPRSGAFLENLVLMQLDAWRETASPRADIFCWRTTSGVEVDFVIESQRRLLPIEVKSASRVGYSDAAGIEQFVAHHPAARWGMVVYGGDELYVMKPSVLAVPMKLIL